MRYLSVSSNAGLKEVGEFGVTVGDVESTIANGSKHLQRVGLVQYYIITYDVVMRDEVRVRACNRAKVIPGKILEFCYF